MNCTCPSHLPEIAAGDAQVLCSILHGRFNLIQAADIPLRNYSIGGMYRAGLIRPTNGRDGYVLTGLGYRAFRKWQRDTASRLWDYAPADSERAQRGGTMLLVAPVRERTKVVDSQD